MRDIEILNYIDRNPVTQADHKRETLWQITIPAVIGVLLILGVAGLVIFGAVSGEPTISTWADISLMWLIIPCFFVTLTLTILVGGMAYGFAKLIGVLPKYTFTVQNFLANVNAKVRSFSKTVSEPVIKTKGAWAGLQSIFRRNS